MKKRLPKTLYVKLEDDGDGGLYPAAAENWEEHAVLGEKHTVGTYELVETSDVISETRKLTR